MMSVNKVALILVEFQNEWISPVGKLYGLMQDKSLFVSALENAKKILAHARKQDFHIIHSGLSFTKNYKELGINARDGLRKHIPHNKVFLKGSEGAQFSSSFNPEQNEFITTGRLGSSAFSGSNLDLYLRNNQINDIYIMGFALHICIESTMRAAHDLGYNVNILHDACSAFNQNQQEYFLHNILPHFGTAISTEEFKNIK